MTRRVTLTLDAAELDALVRLRNLLDPGQTLAIFATHVLVGSVDAELHGIDCECQQMAQILNAWQPQGEPN